MVCNKVGATTEGRERQVVLGVGRRHGGASLCDSVRVDYDEDYDGLKESLVGTLLFSKERRLMRIFIKVVESTLRYGNDVR